MRRLMLIAALLALGTANADAADETPQSAGAFLTANSHGLLEGYLRDYPATRFRRVYPHRYEAGPGKPFWYLCGEINAKNGLGGYTGWETFAITVEGDDRIAITLGTDGPGDAAINVRRLLRLCGLPGVVGDKNTAYTGHDFSPEIAYRRRTASN
jgi:hypothetical protein